MAAFVKKLYKETRCISWQWENNSWIKASVNTYYMLSLHVSLGIKINQKRKSILQ